MFSLPFPLPPPENTTIHHTGDFRASDGLRAKMTAWPKEAHPSSLPPSLPPSSENKTILHTGDFRASDGLRARTTAWLKERGRKIDTVYLDTTYCNAKVCPSSLPPSPPPSFQYTFPPQPSVLASLSLLAQQEKKSAPSTLFYVGTYSIGKERAVRAVAQGIGKQAGREGGREGWVL